MQVFTSERNIRKMCSWRSRIGNRSKSCWTTGIRRSTRGFIQPRTSVTSSSIVSDITIDGIASTTVNIYSVDRCSRSYTEAVIGITTIIKSNPHHTPIIARDTILYSVRSPIYEEGTNSRPELSAIDNTSINYAMSGIRRTDIDHPYWRSSSAGCTKL